MRANPKHLRVEKYDKEKFEQRREKHEFPKAYKELAMCKMCGAVYYKKSWRHNFKNSDYRKLLRKFPINWTICPADRMIKNGQFEGKLTVKNIPHKYKEELIDLIAGFGNRAYQKDSQHRIINIKNLAGNSLLITTTENQMALQMAKKIKNAFIPD